MGDGFGGHSMVAPLLRVAVKSPRAAFRDADTIAAQWQGYGWLEAPDLDAAEREHRRLVELLTSSGAEVCHVPADSSTTIDSVYVHDSVFLTDAGAVLLRSGKENRRPEAAVLGRQLESWGVPILGQIESPGLAESGDLVWLDSRTLLVGCGYRTNDEGVRQLRSLLAPMDVEVLSFDLPYALGPQQCLHLMSLISLVADDLAVVYLPLLPVRLVQLLEQRGFDLIPVGDDEYPTLATNVLALEPRSVVLIEGNPVTAAALRDAGCVVHELAAHDVGVKGEGGPTCLTRPIWRAA